ncbi:MAG: preprotein translocase subunit SecE [Deltaproteobacteria bacterium]|nr:MAG: preprotein translocase subunit SecE [Deltaproteobacteria bacterium]
MTNARLAGITYVVLAVLTGMFLEHVFQLVWKYAGWVDPELLGPEWTVTTVAGFGLAFAAAVAAAMNKTIWETSLEVAAELRKVTWPSWPETKNATIAVIVVSVIVAAFLGTFDVAWKWLTDFIYEATI